MRRLYSYVLLIACVVLFAGCQKDFDGILTAVIEGYEGSGSKVYLDQKFACWHDGDKVMVNGDTCTVRIDNTTNMATIDARGKSSPFTAIYPARYAHGGEKIFTLPQVQTYREQATPNGDMVQVIDAPMVAYSDGTELKFYNAAALMKVDITNDFGEGEIMVMQIELDYVNDGYNLWGKVTYTQESNAAPELLSFPQLVQGALGFTRMEIPKGITIPTGDTKSVYITVGAEWRLKPKLTLYYTTTSTTDEKIYKKRTYSSTGFSKNIDRNTINIIKIKNEISNGTVSTETLQYKGFGLSYDPYQITSAEQLKGLMKDEGLTKHYKLMNDIDLTEMTDFANFGGFGPFDNKEFGGTFDGDGYTIINGTKENPSKTGVFGKCENAVIKNLNIKAYITESNDKIGGVANEIKNRSVVENCKVTGYIQGGLLGGIVGRIYGNSTIKNCVNEALLDGSRVGGIVYLNELGGDLAVKGISVILDCINVGNIKATDYGGGIVSCVKSYDVLKIDHCINRGDVDGNTRVAGIVGYIAGVAKCDIYNCANHGNMQTHQSNDVVCTGGIVGMNQGSLKIYNSYSDGILACDAISTKFCGGIVGYNNGGSVTLKNVYVDGSVGGGYWIVGFVDGRIECCEQVYTHEGELFYYKDSGSGTISSTKYGAGWKLLGANNTSLWSTLNGNSIVGFPTDVTKALWKDCGDGRPVLAFELDSHQMGQFDEGYVWF